MNLDALYGNQPPEHLFHYTSYAGMLGILDTRCVWATEARYLNDAKELANTLDFVLIEVSRRTSSADSSKGEVLSQFRSWLRDRMSSGHALFVVSLTENGNLLSQWRGYTPNNTGVSLGFLSSRLLELGARQAFRMGRCIYGLKEQQEVVRDLIDQILNAASSVDVALVKDRPVSQAYYTLFESFEEKIFLCAALLKHHSFQEEAEWRMVSSLVHDYRSAPIQFRPGASSLIPYMKFDLNDAGGQLTVLRRAYVGPTPNANLAIHAVTMALSRHVSGGYVVVNSMLPLRQV